MKLSKAIEVKLRQQPLFVVIEVDFDIDDEPYVNLVKCFSISEARKIFIERLKSFTGYEETEEDDDEDEEEDEPAPSFEEEYDEEIYTGKFVDYNERYLLQIKEV